MSTKNKGYLIPEIINPQDELCFQVPVPNDPAYVRAFIGQVQELSRWGMWEKDAQHRAVEAAARWHDSFKRIAACGETVEIKDEDCAEAFPTSPLITYLPNDPYQTPNYQPDGYNLPPWRLVDGKPHTDLLSLPTNILELPDLILNSGLPRLKIRFRGEGHVQLYLRDIPQGGYAYITLDGNPAGVFAEMSGLSVLEFNSWFALIAAIVVGSLDGDLTKQHIIEIPVEGSGEHYIDITALPNIGAATLIGFGFQVEKVKICTDEPQELETPMPQFQLDGCILEWRPNSESAWIELGNVCGEDGESPPTPIFLFDGTVLKIDANADGTWDATQDLKGDTGDTGEQGEPAPTPIFDFDGPILKIDADADGDWDLTQYLKGDKGDDGVCLDCGEGYGGLASPDYLCRAARVAAEVFIDEITASVGDLVNNAAVIGTGIQDGLPRSARGLTFTPDWTGLPQWVRDWFTDEMIGESNRKGYMVEHVACILQNHWLDDTTLADFITYGEGKITDDDYADIMTPAAESEDVYLNEWLLAANWLCGMIVDLIAITFARDSEPYISSIYFEANLTPAFPHPSCETCLYDLTPPTNDEICHAAEIAASDYFFEIAGQAGGITTGFGGVYQRILDPTQKMPGIAQVNLTTFLNSTVRAWLYNNIFLNSIDNEALVEMVKNKLFNFWVTMSSIDDFDALGYAQTVDPNWDNNLIDAWALWDLGQPQANYLPLAADGIYKLIAISFYQRTEENEHARVLWANRAAADGAVADCELEEGWSHFFDFTTGSHGFTAFQGSYSAGVGFIHGDSGSGSGARRRTAITRSGISPTITIDRIKVHYIADMTGSNFRAFALGLTSAGASMFTQTNGALPVAGTNTYEHSAHYAGVHSLNANLACDGATPLTGSITITGITVGSDSGTDPFA